MRICILGKYPPIEGGVSASTYWLAHGLAARGHEVTVVTNADEVEDDYRIRIRPEDRDLWAPTFPESGGRVEVVTTEPLSWRMTHIPQHNPFASKLAGLATQVVRSRGCDAIFTHYFEPYAVAAYLAASWTGVPWVVRHAGSDLDRLMRIPELGTAYKELLLRADAVSSRMVRRFIGLGVAPERLFTGEPHSPPPAFFHPGAEPLSIGELPHTLEPRGEDGTPVPFDPSRPTIGIYGKVGVAKGSFDLLRALAILRREGRSFNFLAMTQGTQFESFAEAIRENGLEDRTWVIPFMPVWKVPSFIRTCTAVCFLERDFSIKIHTPMVAYEVLATGGCLVVSGEIARKQAARDAMVDGENVLVVDDPKVHEDLAAKLRTVIDDPERARRIGAAGTALAKDAGAFDRFVSSWEQILLRIAGRESSALSQAEKAAAHPAAETEGGEPDPAGHLARMTPWLDAVLPEQADSLRRRFVAGGGFSPIDPVAGGLAFCEFLTERLEAGELDGDPGVLADCLRFQSHRWRAQRDDDESRRQPSFAATDRLHGRPVRVPDARSLRPLRSRWAEVVELEHDVRPLFASRNGHPPEAERRRTILCFLRAVNLQRTELILSPGTAELLELCDGSRTTAAILDEIATRRAVGPADLPAHEREVIGALQRLYDQRVVVFCSDH